MHPLPPAHTASRGFLTDCRSVALAGEDPGALTSGRRTAPDDTFPDVACGQPSSTFKVDPVPEGIPQDRSAD